MTDYQPEEPDEPAYEADDLEENGMHEIEQEDLEQEHRESEFIENIGNR